MTITCTDLEADQGAKRVVAGVTLGVAPGRSLAVMGPSGSGKSTLFSCIAGLMVPRSGEVWVANHPMHRLNTAQRADIRRKRLGMLYQSPELLSELSVAENVALPLIFDGMPRKAAAPAAKRALAAVGLEGLENRRIHQISGGEAQRVALARALVKPQVSAVIADEPTASLDADNARRITDLLVRSCRERDVALLLATHDQVVADRCDEVVWLPSLNAIGSGVNCA